MMNESWFFGGGFMWIFWVILLVVIILIIKGATPNRSSSNMPANESPLDILKKRYARGEIDESEFNRRRRDLE